MAKHIRVGRAMLIYLFGLLIVVAGFLAPRPGTSILLIIVGTGIVVGNKLVFETRKRHLETSIEEAMPYAKHCPNCGASLSQNAGFCQKCGQQIAA